MSDFDSSLPIRTENPGDAIVKVADATTPSQQLAITAAGEAKVDITQPLPAGTNVIGKATISEGGNDAIVSASGALKVDGSAVTQPVSGSVTAAQGTAAALSGAWPVEITDGTSVLGTASNPIRIDPTGTTAQQVTQGTSPWIVKDQADGPVAPGAAASFSQLVGAQYNSTPPTLTNAQQSALQLDSAGRLLVSASVPSSVTVSNLPATVDTSYGAVGSSTVRTAAQVGNSSGAADFGAGATGAQTLRVEANQGAANATPWNENIAQIAGAAPSASNSLPVQISTGSSFVSSSNPLPVTIDPAAAGAPVNDYKDASAIASGSSDNHDYTVTTGKTLYLQGVRSSASGKAKMVLQIETGVASGIFNAYFAQFNSTASPDMDLDIPAPIHVAAGVRVRVVMSNRDLLAQDLYSTICGYEV